MDLDAALTILQKRLIAERGEQSHWRGRLSSSALSTAVAAYALAQVDPDVHVSRIRAALRWLAGHQNADGGWGDTPESPSNMSTTLLARFAMTIADEEHQATIQEAEGWLRDRMGGEISSEGVSRAVLAFYGNDRTFSAPILTMGVLCGYVGREKPSPWSLAPQLPFEFAVVPAAWYRFLRLQVVSYALPALIAVGLVRHQHRPSKFPPARWLRNLLTPRCLRILGDIQPRSGGYLEAAPLTAFVTMCMARAGYADHPVVQRAVLFLTETVRPDGSWPIDTDLATWVTTLSINAGMDACLDAEQREATRRWLLGQQLRERHPFTRAAPGGWAWTDLSGGVPDADDTSGALLALDRLVASDDAESSAEAERGVCWLLGLQNTDGGIPTFCRGWGKLPFDRSCADLTAHALQAWSVWRDRMSSPVQARLQRAMRKARAYLETTQRDDGSWVPLWFGNQESPGQENPVYGTAQVLKALRKLDRIPEDMPRRAIAFLASVQDASGGWGGDAGLAPTVEETALATSALALWPEMAGAEEAARRGADWLTRRISADGSLPSAPVGLYFASLWYDEKLYPLIFSCAALGAVRALDEAGRE